MLRSRVMASFRTAGSKTCPCSVATLLSSQLCTRTLAIGSCKSEKKAAQLHLAVQQHPLILWTQNFFSNNHGRSIPLFAHCRDRELRSTQQKLGKQLRFFMSYSFSASTEASAPAVLFIQDICLLFPGGHPSKYWAGPTLLNFGDQTRTGVFNVV